MNEDKGYRDYLLTEENVESIVSILDKRSIFTKPYTESREHGLSFVGLRVGQRPDHVVAFWGDTLRVPLKGERVRVYRLTEVRPQPQMTWHTVSPDEARASEALAYEMEQAQIRATCQCSERKADDYTLEIEEGSAVVLHAACGKQPWFMFNDFELCVSMSPQKIVVAEHTGCSGHECYSGSCDCGAEIHLKTPGGNW